MDTSIAQVLWRLSNLTCKLQIGGVSDGFVVSLQRRGLGIIFMQSADPSKPKVHILLPKVAAKTKARTASPKQRRPHAQ